MCFGSSPPEPTPAYNPSPVAVDNTASQVVKTTAPADIPAPAPTTPVDPNQGRYIRQGQDTGLNVKM